MRPLNPCHPVYPQEGGPHPAGPDLRELRLDLLMRRAHVLEELIAIDEYERARRFPALAPAHRREAGNASEETALEATRIHDERESELLGRIDAALARVG